MPTPEYAEKRCRRCDTFKSVAEFYPHRKMRDGLGSYCKPCHVAANRKWRAEGGRALNLYGLRPLQRAELLEAQDGTCAICHGDGDTRNGRTGLHVDHDHVSGAVRGLLCEKCNRGIGAMEDNIDRLLSAVEYLPESASYDRLR